MLPCGAASSRNSARSRGSCKNAPRKSEVIITPDALMPLIAIQIGRDIVHKAQRLQTPITLHRATTSAVERGFKLRGVFEPVETNTKHQFVQIVELRIIVPRRAIRERNILNAQCFCVALVIAHGAVSFMSFLSIRRHKCEWGKGKGMRWSREIAEYEPYTPPSALYGIMGSP